MNWLRQQSRALQAALRQLGTQPIATLLTTLALGVAISLPSGLYLILNNLDRLAGNLPAQPEISIYLDPAIKAPEREAIAARLTHHSALASRRYVPRDQALKALGEAQNLADITAGLEQNPLPDAWVVRPTDPTAEAMAALQTEFEKLPGVAQVHLDSAWAQRLQAALVIGKTTVLLLAGLLGIALVAISGNAIRALILAKRDEIEVSRLIGATDRYIRRPFLYLGALQGLLGGFAAVWVLAVAGLMLRPPIAQLAALYGSQYQLRPPTLLEFGIALASTTLLGWLGAWFTVARTFHQVEAAR
jgi:cell division transport system permease protein